MIHLRLLGGAALTNAAGEEARSVLSQPRRLALLGYLAIEAMDAPLPRGRILPLFWPEADESHARGALNNAVHRLRRSLGAGVIESRSVDELGIDPELLWCDVTAFEAAHGEGDARSALDLYRGHLLPGFAVAGADGFERWLETRRWALREKARTAARSLTDEAEAVGDVEAAAHWTRRSLELVPEDERALRRLVELLGRAGDRAGALDAYDLFARAFEAAHGEPPSAETRAAVEALHQPGAPRSGGPEGGSGEVSSSLDDPRPREPGPPGDRRVPGTPAAARPRRRRRTTLVAGAAFLAAALVAGASLSLRAGLESATAPVRSGSVAFLPFAFYGGASLDYLREGIPRLLASGVDGVGRYRAVDPRTLLARIGETAGDSWTPDRAAGVAGHFRAEYFVLGAVHENAGRLRITASLYGAGPVATLLTESVAEGTRDELFELTDRLALDLLGDLDDEVPRAPGARPATQSISALRAYLEGEDALRAGRYGQAEAAYARAVDADSAFALAYRGLSEATNWNGDYMAARRAAELALRHEGRLSESGRLSARAWLAYLRGRADVAEPLYRSLVAANPTDVDAWFYLGELRFHQRAPLGHPLTESRGAWERVLELDPDHAGALIHLARVAAAQERSAELDRLVDRLHDLEISPGQSLEVRALRAFTGGDTDARQRIRAELAYTGYSGTRTAIWSVAAYTSALDDAAELARTLADPSRPAEHRTVAHLLRVRLLLAAGRLEAVREEVRSLEPLAHAWAVEYRAMAAALPFLPVPEDELESARAAVEALRFTPETDPVESLVTWGRGGPDRRLYLLGAIALKLDDPATAEASARALEDTEPAYARTLRAELALRDGDPAAALEILGDPRPQSGSVPGALAYPTAHEWWLRAGLLEALGREDDALRWLDLFSLDFNLMYRTAAHLRSAVLLERMGETERAARRYRRVLDDWRDADPVLEPLRATARAGLGRTGR